MKLNDGKKMIEITIRRFDGTNISPDWAEEYFYAGSLPYNEETDSYTVDDVDYCVDMAMSENPDEGARYITGADGDPELDESILVEVTVIDD